GPGADGQRDAVRHRARAAEGPRPLWAHPVRRASPGGPPPDRGGRPLRAGGARLVGQPRAELRDPPGTGPRAPSPHLGPAPRAPQAALPPDAGAPPPRRPPPPAAHPPRRARPLAPPGGRPPPPAARRGGGPPPGTPPPGGGPVGGGQLAPADLFATIYRALGI